jgi:uncharacterized protein (DUF2147 family)
MTLRAFVAAVVFTPLLAIAALADPIEGTWQTESDSKSQFGHVEMRSCGGAFCGTLARAYNSAGRQINTPNVGRELVWDLRPSGSGNYSGRILVPIMRSDFPVEMTVAGNTLRLRACNSLGVCRTRTWKRVN